jgi:glycosyl transferase family 25
MQIFVVSLKRAKERRNRLIGHFKERQLEYDLVDAVDGLQLTQSELDAYCDMEVVRKHPNWLTKGMIGACLSHYNIYKKIIEQNLPYACIIEDDVEVDENFKSLLAILEKDILERKFIMAHYTSWQNIELKKVKDLNASYGLYDMQVLEGVNSAACYIISNEVCKKLINLILPIKQGPDSWTEFAKKGTIDHIYAIYPKPVNIIYAKSTIDYIPKGSLKSIISNVINDYKIFPFFQLLKYRRKLLNNKINRIKVIS